MGSSLAIPKNASHRGENVRVASTRRNFPSAGRLSMPHEELTTAALLIAGAASAQIRRAGANSRSLASAFCAVIDAIAIAIAVFSFHYYTIRPNCAGRRSFCLIRSGDWMPRSILACRVTVRHDAGTSGLPRRTRYTAYCEAYRVLYSNL